MNKQFQVLFFTLFYTLGLFSFLSDQIIPLSVAVLISLVVATFRKLISDKSAIVFFIIFAVGIFNCSLRLKETDSLFAVAPQNDITIVGKVTSLPTSSAPNYTKFTLDVEKFRLQNEQETISKAKTIVTLFDTKNNYKNIEIGDKLSLKGRLTKPKFATNPSEFSYGTYLKNKNIFSRLFVNDGNYMVISKPEKPLDNLLFNLNRLRNKMIDMHAKNIKSPELELLGGIVFGDDAINPTPEMKEAFINSGLTHIIAASGMNVTLIFGMWFFISRIFRVDYRLSILIGILSVICYTCMTGFGPPVLRATLMLVLILLGKLFDRKANSVTLLFIVAFLLLFASPTMVTNIGFQLSFVVTLGLLVFCPLIFDKIQNKFVCTLASFVVVPLIAQIFASPIQMYYFNTFSTYSILANIAVVPMLSLVSFLGFASCILAVIKPIATVSVKIFDIALNPFLSAITCIADFFAKLPNSIITVPSPSIIQLFIYYTILITLLVAFLVKERRRIAVLVTLGLVLLLPATYFLKSSNRTPEIIFFDVGNADAALIKTERKEFILIDTGKSPYKNFSSHAQKIIIKYLEDEGINRLDLLVLSHFDSDHAGGTTDIMEKIKVKKILVRTEDNDSKIAKEIFQMAKNSDIALETATNNSISLEGQGYKLTSHFINARNDNESSIINVYDSPSGIVIFAGDTSADAILQLKDQLPKHDRSILKVAHHGANNTVSNELLNFLHPTYAVISTGTNIYGHPSDKTIDELKKHNVKILRTDKDHAIKFSLHKNRLLLYSYNIKSNKFERVKKWTNQIKF